MSQNDEKHPPADISDNEEETDVEEEEDSDANEKSKLLSSEETSPSLSDDEPDQEESGSNDFNQPSTPRSKRLILLIFLALLLWIAFQIQRSLWEGKKKPKIVYASRYSKEHKFRPAASPIITETLKDGRIRLRGALPEPTEPPKPVVKPKKKTKSGKLSGKKKARQAKRKSSTVDKRM